MPNTNAISQPILSARVITTSATPANMAAIDDNPLEKRIERRPDTTLPSETNKICLSTQNGKNHVYLTVSYIPVEGQLDGESICVERPLEFFIPAGQTSGEHQWIAATMRSLSLAARGGFVAKALTDLRKVTWTQGPVRCGQTGSGKPRFHDSEVAAIAWSIQQMLHHRGFLTATGETHALPELMRRHTARLASLPRVRPPADQKPDEPEHSPLAVVGECPDPDCRGDMLLIDNCPTCISCGYSKCG